MTLFQPHPATPPDEGPDDLARRQHRVMEHRVAEWLPPVVKLDEGVVIEPFVGTGDAAAAPDGSNRPVYVALVDVGGDQVHCEWTPSRFKRAELARRHVRIAWDAQHNLRILDDIIP